MSRDMLLRLDYIDLAGDYKAGVMMSQIHYWYLPDKNGKSKLKVVKNGERWLVKSAPDWWAETRLTRREVDRAINLLSGLGLIHVQVFKFANAPTRHIRCPRLEELALGQRGLIAPKQIFQCTQNASALHPTVQSITEITTETTSEMKSLALPSAPLQPPGPSIKLYAGAPPPDDVKINEEPPMKTVSSSAAILAAHQNSAGHGKAKPANTSGSLQAIWRHDVPRHNDEVKFLAEFTLKTKGQFSLVAKALGVGADEVTRYVVRDWVGYTKFVAAQKGKEVGTTPNSPDVGFLLKYATEAMNFVTSHSYVPVKSKKAPPLQLVAPAATIAAPPTVVKAPITKPKKDVATLAEIMNWKPEDDEDPEAPL